MKLKYLEFLDILKSDDQYRYIYGAKGSTLFSNKFYKIIFTSNIPHWWWSEIQKKMLKENITFEHILNAGKIDIGMGTLDCYEFQKNNLFDDYIHYTKNRSYWKTLLNEAIDTQEKLKNEYNKENGKPDLTKYSLFN